MPHEILSIKLCELDEAIGRMHSRIHLSETEKHSQLQQEIQALCQECAQAEMVMREKLQFSRAGVVAPLEKAYTQIEQIIRSVKEEQQKRRQDEEDSLAEEEKLLLAEYALDFAVQAANHALLLALQAVDAQIVQQEKEVRT